MTSDSGQAKAASKRITDALANVFGQTSGPRGSTSSVRWRPDILPRVARLGRA
jgi:hypothetical protein